MKQYENILEIERFLKKFKKLHSQYEDSLENWLSDFKSDQEKIFLENYSEFERKVSLVSSEYNKIIKDQDLLNETEAWDFSIFNIVQIKRPEENLHSPFIAELLDTQGSHGQKDLFYKLFLYEILGQKKAAKFINSDYQDYYIQCEEFIRNKHDKGEIDITIKSTSPNKDFAIILENKWGSGDSCPDQLFKYYRNFTNKKGKGYTDDNLLVIYLTIYGGDPTWVENKKFATFLTANKNRNYFPISYIKDIRGWLEKSMHECKSVKVKNIINQYLNMILWHR